MKVKRGEYGYIKVKKRISLMKVVLMLLAGMAVFIVGLLLNKMSNRNIFTVIAVLFSLPGAKFLVAFIVLFPHHSAPLSSYQKVKEKLPEGMTLYADLVITSSEKVMHLDFAAVGNGQVIGLIASNEKDLAYVRKYLTEGVRNWGEQYKVRIVDSEKKFIAELSGVARMEVKEDEEAKVKSYLVSLIV